MEEVSDVQRKKWIPGAVALAGMAVVAIPFVYVSRPKSPHAAGGEAATAAPTAPALPSPSVLATEHLSAEQKEMAMLEQHLASAPGHTPVLMRLAELARQSGKIADAVKYLRKAVETDGKNEDARLELGRALFEAGDIQGATIETKALLEMNPTNADALYNLGAIEGNLGNFAEARRHWEAVVKASPSSESAAKSRAALTKLPQ
jgi:cytochrome c-type biogenesis protein CcmH/NrfG